MRMSSKTLIAVPCMANVPTGFMSSLIGMSKPQDAMFAITESSLIHSARNLLAGTAIEGGYDRIMWIDSDMRVPPDLFNALSADIDKGMEYVSGLYFMRTMPTRPVIYKDIELAKNGNLRGVIYKDYPRDSIFEIAASGFGALMMTTRLYVKALQNTDSNRNPFHPIRNLGEDLAFCWRLPDEVEMYCDSRIKVPHIGYIDYTEDMYDDED